MQFAIDENGVRTSINNSIKGKPYKCPCCGSEVIQKKGDIMIWHFAHKSLADCVDYYDHKGEWHRAMQELFPEKNREVYEKTFMYRHIFDILTDKGRIIEFQHSPISINDFQQRTHDYLLRSIFEETKRAIWVFDFSEREFTVGSKRYDWNDRARKIYWSRAKNLFGDYRNYNGKAQYELWLYISPYSSRLDKNVNCFLRVLGAYSECHSLIGEVYTKEEFEKYITSQ